MSISAATGVYDGFSLALGARLGRTEIHARLGGPEAAVHLNAAQIMGGTQISDFTTAIAHDAPNCASRQTVKSVLTGKSRAVFQGRIEVARIAQKTDGYQMNQALLLSPDAEINSKPELEIYADDVKCSHGATVGALDPEQFFYLRSRGIPADDGAHDAGARLPDRRLRGGDAMRVCARCSNMRSRAGGRRPARTAEVSSS